MEGGCQDRFVGYGKIYEHSHLWGRAKLPREWVVTEKVHGANMVITCFSDNSVRCGKRRSFLDSSEAFFGYERVLEEIRPAIVEAARLVRERIRSCVRCDEVPTVRFFGEIFGGRYPHPEVAVDEMVEGPVQTGIWYHPSIKFCLFDIAVDQSDFLNYDDVVEIASACSLLYASILYRGSFQGCLAFDIRFPTRIPALLGLPPLDDPNLAEGIVIKPVNCSYVESRKGKIRLILKRKISEFGETEFGRAEKWKEDSVVGLHVSSEKLLFYDAQCFITLNRLHNAISKVGRPNPRNKEKLLELLDLYVEDILEEARDSFEVEWTSLATHQQYKFRAMIEAAAKDEIRSYFGRVPREPM